jgi:predicted RNA methylase
MTLKIFLIAVVGITALAQQPTGEKLAPYYPTPETIVKRMLEFGELKAGEKMFDLGSGDGRIIIMAAQKYGADATGVELDGDLYISSEVKIRALGVQKSARFSKPS